MDGLPLTPRVPRATLEKLRSVVRDCLEKHLDDSAVFFADKAKETQQMTQEIQEAMQAIRISIMPPPHERRVGGA